MSDIKLRTEWVPEAPSPSPFGSEGSGAGYTGHATLCPHSTGPMGKCDWGLQLCLSPAPEATELTHLGATHGRSYTERLEIKAGLTRLSCSCEAACGVDVEESHDRPKF